jgi:hypothetical protein
MVNPPLIRIIVGGEVIQINEAKDSRKRQKNDKVNGKFNK